jgi:hypothetical protein
MHRREEAMKDLPTPAELRSSLSLNDIARTKAHNYAQEYNPYTGQVNEKANYHALREGYIDGFLAGFKHRLTGGNDE